MGPSTRERPEAAELTKVAKQCLKLVAAVTVSQLQAADRCKTDHILIPGGAKDLGKEAARHDLAVIEAEPDWVSLTYMSGAEKRASGVRREWYTNVPYLAGCAHRRVGQECDEYPLYTTVEGGPDAANQAGTKLVLKPISQADNKAEGSAHSAMVRTCEMQSAVGAPGGQASGGDGFLVIPVPHVNVPSFFICGGPSGGGGGGGAQ